MEELRIRNRLGVAKEDVAVKSRSTKQVRKNCLLLLLLLLALTLALPGCAASDPLTEDVYFTHIHYAAWEEMHVGANEVGDGWPAPGAANFQSGYAYLFPDVALPADETYVHFNVQMPRAWKEGTDIYFVVHFAFNANEVGTNVRWHVGYSWADQHAAFPVVAHTWILSDPSNNDVLVHQVARSVAINGTGHHVGSEVLCYLSRNASDALDTYTDTAVFTGVSVLYQVDAPGSANQWTK